MIILSTLSITISIHKALTSLDFVYPPARRLVVISIHKALASLDRAPAFRVIGETAFQSTRLSRASTEHLLQVGHFLLISIHKALRASTIFGRCVLMAAVFQSTRLSRASTLSTFHNPRAILYFNPQGSREPRHQYLSLSSSGSRFQSTRLSRASTLILLWLTRYCTDFNPQGSREPRREGRGAMERATEFQSTRLSRASTIS